MNAEQDFLRKLIVTFKTEADEHVQALASGLVELEAAPGDDERADAIERIFRTAHSLKGAARSVDIGYIESLCQSLENIFSALKKQQISPSSELFDLLQQAVDHLSILLAAIDSNGEISDEPSSGELRARLTGVSGGVTGQTPKVQPSQSTAAQPIARPPGGGINTIRISTTKLSGLILQTEELLLSRLAASDRISQIKAVGVTLDAWQKEHKEDRTLADFAGVIRGEIATIEARSALDARALSGLVDTLIADMKQVMMLPFSSALELLPKLARDLARHEGKELDLVVKGADIEVDRRILESMKDPFVHLLRNAIDHGIETPDERAASGKNPRGKVRIDIEQAEGNKVDIVISDDGTGIDLERVRASAARAGLLEQDRGDSDEQVLGLLFRSGISTSPLITDISGRGLGLAIVEEKTEQLGGSVSIESRPGEGTTVKMTIPVALATFRGILIRAGGMLAMLPIINVERVLRVYRRDINTLENREEILLGGKAVSLMKLAEVLGTQGKTRTADFSPCVIVEQGDKRIAFLVDEIIEEQEVLVKSLGKQLSRVRNISGVAVLGSGKIVPVISIGDLMKSAISIAAGPMQDSDMVVPRKSEKITPTKRILVVEDSITARTLLKNILETAGYQVRTAVDGLDALTILRGSKFDLIASDITMPRMDGLELTAKIRADKRTADLPVVLVSAMESRDDREQGMEAGASAYIVKSSFDQSNLLEVIERLI